MRNKSEKEMAEAAEQEAGSQSLWDSDPDLWRVREKEQMWERLGAALGPMIARMGKQLKEGGVSNEK